MEDAIHPGSVWLMRAAALDQLLGSLRGAGYRVIGPTVRDGAIILDELTAASDLPFGWGVQLEPGGYRLRRRSDSAAFGHSAGPEQTDPRDAGQRRSSGSVVACPAVRVAVRGGSRSGDNGFRAQRGYGAGSL